MAQSTGPLTVLDGALERYLAAARPRLLRLAPKPPR
jgi:hypothetical protein